MRADHAASFRRVALSYYVTSGLSAAVGLFLIASCVRWTLGSFAAAAATIGVIVVVPPDQPAPRRGKIWQLVPAIVIAIPLFYAMRVLHANRLHVGLLLVPATFISFLAAAWGRRGIPVSMSAMFAIVFALAVPAGGQGRTALLSTAYFALGAVSYACYATLANSLLNWRYRVQMLSDTLAAMAALMRILAGRFDSTVGRASGAADPLNELLRQQAALADQLQIARNMLLESPRTARRQRLAGMLVRVLEMRDHLLACELDVDLLVAHAEHAAVLDAMRATLRSLADELERLADSLLVGRTPRPFTSVRRELMALSTDALARALAARVGNISDEMTSLTALARGEAQPDLAVVRASWQMFVSPTAWSWQPLTVLWRWDAPPLRHALRATLAIGTAYVISLAVPWGTHAYWILLTIVVVLRGSLAQTLERRNSRVAGTLVGSVLAGALLATGAPILVLTLIVTLAQGLAHAFAVKRYLVTAIAATVLALVQAHLLNAELSPAFEALERIADTLIGVGVAWGFSYVLPAWERTQIPALITRALEAHARLAHSSLGLSQLTAVDNRPELEWRLARRESYDSLSALVQAAQRCLSEPRAVRPPLEPLLRLLARSYQLLAQLTAVKTLLLVRRGQLQVDRLTLPLQQSAQRIEAALGGEGSLEASHTAEGADPSTERADLRTLSLPDPFGEEMTPWLLRRLALSVDLAGHLRDDARGINSAMHANTL